MANALRTSSAVIWGFAGPSHLPLALKAQLQGRKGLVTMRADGLFRFPQHFADGLNRGVFGLDGNLLAQHHDDPPLELRQAVNRIIKEEPVIFFVEFVGVEGIVIADG
jgi:hypothetical protein